MTTTVRPETTCGGSEPNLIQQYRKKLFNKKSSQPGGCLSPRRGTHHERLSHAA
ncbi:hypothetical protein COLO4_08677 [Corchorus olitorius]|uniref:Uncharacterized protein n=1 Tax=Corchorus olitorius TaxID=93759 RepID=A0A1R3KEY4_9ROSI|nr:hypothetical protein COLO4_08677 [Corchorus olitorius]